MTLTLYLAGPVRLVCPARGDITPRSQKARGALALLGSAHGMRMARAQLQDRLWSESSTEQGAASLRQMLRELRNALGPTRDALVSGPGWVGLDETQVVLNLTAPYHPGAGPTEFAADLDIGDPEFEDWLREARSHHEARLERDRTGALAAAAAAPPQPQPQPLAAPTPPLQAPTPAKTGLMKLFVNPPNALDQRARLSAAILVQEACWRASELLPAELVTQMTTSTTPDPDDPHAVTVNSVATLRGPQMVVLVNLAHADTGRVITMREFAWPAEAEMEQMPHAIWTLASLIMASSKTLAMQRNSLTLWDMFQFDRKKLIEADQRLVELQQEQPGRAATLMALRAFMRWTMVIERLDPNPGEMTAEADELAAKARCIAPNNASVLGVSALLMTEMGKKGVAKELALMAESADPHESFGRLAMVQTLLDHGRGEEAYVNISSMRGSLLASVAPASWYLQRARTEVRLGLFEQAEISTSTAHSFAPRSRAALRFMGVLQQARGDEAGAEQSFAELRVLEPGFRPEMLADPAYPAGSLRMAGLVKV